MISRIDGELIRVDNGRAEVRAGDFCYELLVPATNVQRLHAILGQPVTFHTLYYLESQGQGNTFLPRLIGFHSPEDRAFFELFVTVKGMGNRKALRALDRPFGEVAHAIAERDVDLLKSLPEVGKRTAETIVTELSGKVDRFVEVKGVSERPALDEATATVARDAVTVLVQLGEQKVQAQQLVERAITADPTLETPDQLVAAAFRLKE